MEFKPDRRDFSAMAAAAPMAFQGAGGKRKLCVIGATGRGDWGHGLDTSFSHRPDIELVAVADASPAGLKKAADKLKAPKSYA
ncbi:MAG: gfo/Idh/MocA family oxidoreductase, partial [Planctomycetota bacterium]